MTRRRRWLLVGGILPLLSTAAAALWVRTPLPPALLARPTAPGVTLLDRHGIPLRQVRSSDGSRSGWMPLGEIDPQIIQAFLAQEDRRFLAHGGVDARAAARAAAELVRYRRVVSGASTITMQLARLLHGETRRGPRAKLAQTLWALRLEHHLDKQQILEQYLNRVPLGEGAVGVSAAAAYYFGASAGRLSLGQAALLAGMAHAPSRANPVRSPERAAARRTRVLDRMVALGYADSASAARANLEPIAATGTAAPFLAPHFTSRLLAWLADSATRPAGPLATSLDLDLQAQLEAELRSTVALLRDREVHHAAAVVVANATGEILAWVGSPDFWADTAGQVDMVVAPRQPGSTLKPFVYAMALDRGWTAASVLPDVARAYRTATGPYQPRNYDRRFHGPVRVREALGSSFNVPAVEITDRLGAGALLAVLRDAGFHSLRAGADYYGLGLSLGNGDVSLLELANAYRAMVAGGVTRPVRWTAADPGDAAPARPRATPFATPGANAIVLDMLADADARMAGFGADTPFDFPFPVAVKTGTSHHFTDNWAVGATGGFTVAVWVGNFSGRPMRRVSGVTGAGPLLHRAVLATARRYDPGLLPSPAAAGATRARVCRLSGAAAGPWCQGVDEWFLPGTVPAGICDWHRSGGVVWPEAYAEWVAQHPREARELGGDGHHGGVVPTDAATLRIVSPRDGDRYEVPPRTDARYATIALRAVGARDDERLRWFVNDEPVRGGRWIPRSGTHTVRVVASDGRSALARVMVR